MIVTLPKPYQKLSQYQKVQLDLQESRDRIGR